MLSPLKSENFEGRQGRRWGRVRNSSMSMRVTSMPSGSLSYIRRLRHLFVMFEDLFKNKSKISNRDTHSMQEFIKHTSNLVVHTYVLGIMLRNKNLIWVHKSTFIKNKSIIPSPIGFGTRKKCYRDRNTERIFDQERERETLVWINSNKEPP